MYPENTTQIPNTQFCRKCGAVLPIGYRFCDKCGTPTTNIATNFKPQSNTYISPSRKINRKLETISTLSLVVSVIFGIAVFIALIIALSGENTLVICICAAIGCVYSYLNSILFSAIADIHKAAIEKSDKTS